MIDINRHDWDLLNREVKRVMEEWNPISHSSLIHWFQKDLAAASGLNTTTLRKIALSEVKATKAQRRALAYALLEKALNLRVAN